ncbi:CHASE4 domain-containing protein [Paenibacillus sp. 1_12]|uniref:ATP-binding protein n=1 Tax=Paenibacillus sp. 1_12 TaxID=1566278 RepID=UPI0008E6579A|nr:ATP-binding protein [Paenibacillus sp. 1_12]SFK68312.1 CHASE4 domain-containing protein [Paenibacillus sp. 1_12]
MNQIHKRRSFMRELLIWVVLLIVAPLVAVSFLFYQHEISGMNKIEQEKSILTNRTAQKLVERLGDTILGITVTNGYWEDNRQAVLNHDLVWIQDNVGVVPDVVPNIDFVAETDLQGNVLVQSGDVEELKTKVLFPFILAKFQKESKFSGILNTSKGLAIVAVSPVTSNKGEADPVGIVIFGRLLSDEIIVGLKDTLQADISLLVSSGQFFTSTKEITAEQLQIYMNGMKTGGGEHFNLERRGELLVAQSAAPFLDMEGKTIGALYAELPTRSTTEAADRLRILGLCSLGGMLLLLGLVILMVRQRIILPLRHFTLTLEEVAAGRTVKELPKHVQHAEAQIVGAIDKIMQWNQVLERTVAERTGSIRSLLDNARQGFMSIGPDLRVKEEYSVECTRIFKQDIAGLQLGALFYAADVEEATLLESILAEFYSEQDEWKRELIFSLLPDEVLIQGMVVQVEFKYLSDVESAAGQTAVGGAIMVMLTDITETRRLEEQMNRERKRLQMVVHVITHSEDYAQITRSFETFCNTELVELSGGNESVENKLLEIYKSIHTFKGSFALLQFMHIVPKLHELESELMELLGREVKPTWRELELWLRSLRLNEWLEEDSLVLKEALGDATSEMGIEYEVKLTKEQWQHLERELIMRLTLAEDRLWLAGLRKWRFKPLKALIQHYPAYLSELAERNGLLLHPIELNGADIPVDPDRLNGLTQSLIHIVRNIVIHGIESPEERVEQGKDEYATVSFSIEQEQNELTLTISDNGRGIDLEAVKSRAESSGLLPTHNDTTPLSNEHIANLIFKDQLSTTKHTTEWSGRGIGLAAVKAEAEKLGGTVRVSTSKGRGTAFIVKLPYEDISAVERVG